MGKENLRNQKNIEKPLLLSLLQMASKGQKQTPARAPAAASATTVAVPESWEDVEIPEVKAPAKSAPKGKKGYFFFSFFFFSSHTTHSTCSGVWKASNYERGLGVCQVKSCKANW